MRDQDYEFGEQEGLTWDKVTRKAAHGLHEAGVYGGKSEVFIENMVKGAIGGVRKEIVAQDGDEETIMANISAYFNEPINEESKEFAGHGLKNFLLYEAAGKKMAEAERWFGVVVEPEVPMEQVAKAVQSLKRERAGSRLGTAVGWGLAAVGVLYAVTNALGWFAPSVRAENDSVAHLKKARSEVTAPAPDEVVTEVADGVVEAKRVLIPEPTEMPIKEYEFGIKGTGLDLSKSFSVRVPVEVMKLAGKQEEFTFRVDPGVEDEPEWNRENKEMLKMWGVHPDFGVVANTHVPGLNLLAVHAGDPGGKWMNMEWLQRVPDEDLARLKGLEIFIIQDGREVPMRFVAVRDADAQLLDAGGDAMGRPTGDIKNVHFRLDKLGFWESEWKQSDVGFLTCEKTLGGWGERRIILASLVEPGREWQTPGVEWDERGGNK